MLDEKILNILKDRIGSYVSGEEMCESIGVSRTAIWKWIEKLRLEGYDIEASPHLGYRLKSIPDSLIPIEIKWKLRTKILGKEIISYKKVSSTNDVAYELAEKGMAEGTCILAEEQTKGKGRHGRKWVSPQNVGIYLSCILRPNISPNEIPKFTLLAAVAVARAVRELTALDAMIKWPNDVVVNNKKICGILTEMKGEQDRVSFIIIGIGVNVNTSMRDLPDTASSIKEELRRMGASNALSRVELVKKILETLEKYYYRMKKEGFRTIMEEWKNLTLMLGSRIKVILQNRTLEGQAHDIDSDGALVVRLDSGMLERVSSGDVVIIK